MKAVLGLRPIYCLFSPFLLLDDKWERDLTDEPNLQDASRSRCNFLIVGISSTLAQIS